MLATPSQKRPTQCDLRRALSTAYYALFHTLARTSADLLVGGPKAVRSKHAWRQVYRALEHGAAKNACMNGNIMRQFPREIEAFGNVFATMQIKRHHADYDPLATYDKLAILQDIDNADHCIKHFGSVAVKDRRAFCAYVLFKTRSDLY